MAEHAELREPVLDDHETDAYEREKVLKQWDLLSGLALRELKTDHSLREALLPLAQEPLSEKTAERFFDVLKDSNNVAVQRLAQRYEHRPDGEKPTVMETFLSLALMKKEYPDEFDQAVGWHNEDTEERRKIDLTRVIA